MIRILTIVAFALITTACAFGDESLTVAYNAETAKQGLISEAPPATVYLADVEDRRVEKERVGYKRNGYGMKTADILSERPAPEVVKEALAAVLTKNNHVLGPQDSRYALQTTLTNFWFDYKSGFVSVEFYGSIQAELSLVDQTSGQKVYSEIFDGYYSEKTGGGLKKTWERIMNAALDDLANKVNLSTGFKDALATVAAAQTAPTPIAAAETPGS